MNPGQSLLAIHGGQAGVDWWVWPAFTLFIACLLALDLFVLHRNAHALTLRQALAWTSFWVALGVGFGGLVFAWLGATRAGEYYAGYLIEWSLSVDNVFVFALIFSYFAVPLELQRRVLFWGIVGALFFRATFILTGAELLERVSWTKYSLGIFLLLAGGWMLRRRRHELHPEKNPALRLARRVLPITRAYHGERFFVVRAGKWLATPLVLVLLVVETTDIVFAIDSIPAILAVTTSAFVVFAANAFAILGLRSLYFCVASVMWRFVYLSIGLSLVLVYVGAKLVLSDVVGDVSIGVSLSVIVTVIAASIVASLAADRLRGSPQELAERGPSAIEPATRRTLRLPEGRPDGEGHAEFDGQLDEHRRRVSVEEGRDQTGV